MKYISNFKLKNFLFFYLLCIYFLFSNVCVYALSTYDIGKAKIEDLHVLIEQTEKNMKDFRRFYNHDSYCNLQKVLRTAKNNAIKFYLKDASLESVDESYANLQSLNTKLINIIDKEILILKTEVSAVEQRIKSKINSLNIYIPKLRALNEGNLKYQVFKKDPEKKYQFYLLSDQLSELIRFEQLITESDHALEQEIDLKKRFSNLVHRLNKLTNYDKFFASFIDDLACILN